jgi:ChrR Cupin-like domain
MTAQNGRHGDHQELISLYVLQALSPIDRREAEATIAACADCREELESLKPTVDAFVFWPTDVLRPDGALLWERLADRIGIRANSPSPVLAASDWEETGTGISYKILANDTQHHRVSMLVRLAPGAAYPPHTHAGVEELYLLDGELFIDGRKLYPGDYNRAEMGTGDQHVWSETGCTCVLLTASDDVLR